MRSRLTFAIGVLVTGLVAWPAAQKPSLDYTQWRGQNRDGSASSFVEPKTWPETLTRRWSTEVGTGYATPLVVGDRVYVFARRADNETMSALEAASGKVLWENPHPVTFTMNKGAARHGMGPKSTPVYADGKLFSIGMTGVMTGYDAKSGKELWRKPGLDAIPMFTTHAFSPIVDRGLVFFHQGGHDKGAITALDVNTGAAKWSWDGDGPSYGSPIIVELGGSRQLIALTQGRLVGLDVATGAVLWERPFVSSNSTNSATPILAGQTLIVSNGGPVTAINLARRDGKWTTEDAWTNADQPYRLSNPVVVGDTLFGLSTRNSGQYFAIDVRTGKTLWTSEPRQAAQAAFVKAGPVFFSLEDDGELVILRANPAAFELLRRYKLAETDTWTQPTISGNRVFLKDVSTLTLWTIP
jgi:outer membrane protein assembly factor BamB